MAQTTFTGDRKAPMRSPLAKLERWFIDANVKRFPPWIEGWHLTLATIPLSLGLLGFGYLAQFNLLWLWGASLMQVAQWFTDSFDGALGRHRDFGIPKWGFYMDHLLDYLFMWCAPVAYIFIVPEASVPLVFAFAFLYSAMMASAFLGFAATNEFKITYLGMGPTEIRLLYVILNTVVILRGPQVIEAGLPWAVGVLAVGLAVIVIRTQRRVWRLDRASRGR